MSRTSSPSSGKRPVLSVTLKDCEVEHFRCGGPGGQNVNKRSTGTRITHLPSGASVRCCEHRTQHQNTQAAFMRLTASPKFRLWINLYLAQGSGGEEIVRKSLVDEDELRIEVRKAGKWTVV